jgi:hypothetical protein
VIQRRLVYVVCATSRPLSNAERKLRQKLELHERLQQLQVRVEVAGNGNVHLEGRLW